MAALALAHARSPTKPCTPPLQSLCSPLLEKASSSSSVLSVEMEFSQTMPSSLQFGVLMCSGDVQDPSAINFLKQRDSAAADVMVQEKTRVLCVSGRDDPLVSTEDCRALAQRLAHNGAFRDLPGHDAKNTSGEKSGNFMNGLQSESPESFPGNESIGLDYGSTLETNGAPSRTLVSFLSVAGGHGMPPGRDMAAIKAFVMDSLI